MIDKRPEGQADEAYEGPFCALWQVGQVFTDPGQPCWSPNPGLPIQVASTGVGNEAGFWLSSSFPFGPPSHPAREDVPEGRKLPHRVFKHGPPTFCALAIYVRGKLTV